MNIHKYGNVSVATIPLAIHELSPGRKAQEGGHPRPRRFRRRLHLGGHCLPLVAFSSLSRIAESEQGSIFR